MRISATGTSSRGFTLLELMVVLVILAGATALVLPRLSGMQDADTRSSARNIATMLRYLDERAVAGRIKYKLNIDLDEQKISVQQFDQAGEARLPDDTFLQRNPLIGSTLIYGLSTERTGGISSGRFVVNYGVGGLSEALILHLGATDRRQYTVQALPVSGAVKVAEGRLEMIR